MLIGVNSQLQTVAVKSAAAPVPLQLSTVTSPRTAYLATTTTEPVDVTSANAIATTHAVTADTPLHSHHLEIKSTVTCPAKKSCHKSSSSTHCPIP